MSTGFSVDDHAWTFWCVGLFGVESMEIDTHSEDTGTESTPMDVILSAAASPQSNPHRTLAAAEGSISCARNRPPKRHGLSGFNREIRKSAAEIGRAACRER